MYDKIIGELTIMESLNIKPNYAALGRKYDLDWRTVKKSHDGYKGKPKTRDKPSKLDVYKNEISDKLKIRRATIRGVYEFMVDKYGSAAIGCYSNFRIYVEKQELVIKERTEGHARYETLPGILAECDWKENISLTSRSGTGYVINIFHLELKYSRYSYIELSVSKQIDDVYRCLSNAFSYFGGVPKEILFDNMSTVANVQVTPKKPTAAITRFSKDFGFKVRLCKARTPETKGSVEARNKILDWIRPFSGEFKDLEDLIPIIEKINSKMNIKVIEDIGLSPVALFYQEKEHLLPIPKQDVIDNYLMPNRYKVGNDALIRYEGNKYSVDPKLIDKEVTVDVLANKLYVYYNGKLVTYHPLSNININYKDEHYKALMKGKQKEEDMNRQVEENLRQMDKILNMRKMDVSPIEATKSFEALIAFINQNPCGRWVINNLSQQSSLDRLEFCKGINKVLPYVENKDVFIEHIKYSLKNNNCKTIDFDCYINDLTAACEEECILSEDGYNAIGKKYKKEIEEFLTDMEEASKDKEMPF